METLPVVMSVGSFLAALLSVGLMYVKFGREIHVDDKREILRQLVECKGNCEALEKRLESAEREISGYRRDNYELLQELREQKRRNGIPKG